jgi:branched-chain amino acid aminotransferase
MLTFSASKTTTPKTRPAESELGFGKFFTDHVLVAEYRADGGWRDARIEPYGKLQIDPAAGALHYGQAIFEGLKAFRQKDGSVSLFRVDAHAKRMTRGAERLCMQALDPKDFVAGMKAYVAAEETWVPSSKNTALYLRPTLIATEAFLGVGPSNEFLFFTIASRVGSYYGGDSLKPVRIWVERDYTRAASWRHRLDQGGRNYAASMYAAVKAKKAGFDQVLWLDAKEHAFVEEVGTMNLFVVIGDKLVTPQLHDSISPCDTRLDPHAGEGSRRAHRRTSHRRERAVRRAEERRPERGVGFGTAAVVSPSQSFRLGDDKLVINGGKTG